MEKLSVVVEKTNPAETKIPSPTPSKFKRLVETVSSKIRSSVRTIINIINRCLDSRLSNFILVVDIIILVIFSNVLLVQYFVLPLNIGPPRMTGHKMETYDQMYKLLVNEFHKNFTLIQMDDKYCLTDQASLMQFVIKNSVSTYLSRSEKLDCDDFAIMLMGDEKRWFLKAIPALGCSSAFGFIAGNLLYEGSVNPNYHALNLAIFYDTTLQQEKVLLIEPQNDRIITELWPTSEIYYVVI